MSVFNPNGFGEPPPSPPPPEPPFDPTPEGGDTPEPEPPERTPEQLNEAARKAFIGFGVLGLIMLGTYALSLRR